MMKMLLACLVIFLAATEKVSAMDHNDLVNFTTQYVTQLGVKEDPKHFLKCIDDEVIAEWETSIFFLKKINWSKIEEVLIGMLLFFKPSVINLVDLLPCSEGDIKKWIDQIEKILDDEKEFTNRLMNNINLIKIEILGLIERFEAKSFGKAGQHVGEVMRIIFHF